MTVVIAFLMSSIWMANVFRNAQKDILLKMVNVKLKSASLDIIYQEIAAKNVQSTLILNNVTMLVQKEQSFEASNASSYVQQNIKFTAMENASV